MLKFIRTGIDISAAVLLAAVLLLVYRVERSKVPPPIAEEPPPPRVRMAVTPGTFDNMGELLETLGEGYRFEVVDESELEDPAKCGEFDAIFLTCTKPDRSGVAEGAGSRPSRLASALRKFVDAGGTLYASDLRYDILKEAFPKFVDRSADTHGLKEKALRATVRDPDLREVLGPEVRVHFDLDGWRPAAFDGREVTKYLQGSFKTDAGVSIEAPLLVKFPYGKGTVLFTSFHSTTQNSELETKLLKYLVLSTVTAGVETRWTQEMVRGGLSPKSKSLLSPTPGEREEMRTYQLANGGPLKFSLIFEPRGARLRLKVISPKGEERIEEGRSTITIDVPDAAAGKWQYTAVAEAVPYENFPCRLVVAEAGPPDEPSSVPPIPVPTPEGATVQFKEVALRPAGRTRSGPPRIGVTSFVFDDMAKLLDKLGEGFKYTTIDHKKLNDTSIFDPYDIVFLTCAALPAEWFESVSKVKGERDGVGAGGKLLPENREKLGEALRRFVARGGTLYASDMRADLLYIAFGERRPRAGLNPAILPKLAEAEREWIKVKAPSATVGTIEECLRKAGLGKALEDHLDLLVAVVEDSSLGDGGLRGGLDNVARIVRAELQGFNLSDADVMAIARALEEWDRKIQGGFKGRNSSKRARAREQIEQAENRRNQLRMKLFRLGTGSAPQVVTAEVIDRGLRERLGESTIPLNFTMNGWMPAWFRGDGVTVLMQGKFEQTSGEKVEAPLLVKFPVGEGTVIFTSFHNEAINSKQEEQLLRYLVFAAVTAKEDAVADRSLLKGGFAPVKRNVESHSLGNPTITRKYTSTKPGPLRFSITFAGEGARLRFTLVAPNGDKFEKEVTSPLAVEATGAPAGEWLYTVTALNLPFKDFPFSVGVAETTTPPPAR